MNSTKKTVVSKYNEREVNLNRIFNEVYLWENPKDQFNFLASIMGLIKTWTKYKLISTNEIDSVIHAYNMLSPDIYVKIHCNNCGEDHKCKTRFMVLFCPYCGNDFSE
jgi:hypothetical protein